ncbi:MAG: cbb3-type cytochrome c oxidase subunit I [Actinomycetota bacterium]
MWVQHLSSLDFLTYVAFFGVVVAAIFRFVPGKAAPARDEPYSYEELTRHDAFLAKYFVAGGAFLVLGSTHMLLKNLPWTAEWLARGGYAGHLVRDLSNTHVMIVGGGTLLATGLTWYALPRIVQRPLASNGMAHFAFWLTAVGLVVFYIALVGDGIAMSRLVQRGWEYRDAKAHLGKWYKVPIGIGAGVMGLGYWCFASNVLLTVFQARLVRVPKPHAHLWKFLATGALALTVGTVQGVIQVTPRNADWLYRAKHAGEWIDPISHAHVNLVTGLTMLVAGALFFIAPQLGGTAPSRKRANAVWGSLLGGSLAFYATCLYLGFHEGSLVVGSGLTPDQAEKATPLHGPLIVGSGVLMFAAFWFLLATLVATFRHAPRPVRSFVFAGCGALALGTLQGPVQAVPAVNELLDRGGDAGDVIVNLHAQLNMLGGLMVLLVGAVLALRGLAPRRVLGPVAAGMGIYYAAGVAFSALEASRVSDGASFGSAVSAFEPWSALVLVPAAAAVLLGFSAYARAVWRGTQGERLAGQAALRALPDAYAGKIPVRVRRLGPAKLAAYELPMGLLGFPGLGWLFGGFPFQASVLLCSGPALAWAVLPIAFTPYGEGPLRSIGWKIELAYLPVSALLSAAFLYRAHRKRRLRSLGATPRTRRRRRGYRTRVSVAVGSIVLILVSLPLVPAVAGLGSGKVRYTLQTRLTKEVTGQFLVTPRGPVKLFAWQDPQASYPGDALRVRARDARTLLVRAAALDAPSAYRLYNADTSRPVPLGVRSRGGRSLSLAPVTPLQPGRYVFAATHEGMFGGRDYAYLTIVPPNAAVSPLEPAGTRTAPVAKALPPIAATLLALAFALLLARSYRRRPAAQKALWATGFLLFAVAAACEAVAQRNGWTVGLFRVYYLCGGVLTVAALGAGSAMLQLRPRGRDALLGGLAVAAAAATAAVLLAPVDVGALAATAAGRPPANGALGGHAFLWAIALNSIGTILLVGGSALSIVRRRNVRANVWIGCGALVVALATGLSRGGAYSLVYVGQLAGIALMFAGFTLPAKAAPRVEPRHASVRAAAR